MVKYNVYELTTRYNHLLVDRNSMYSRKNTFLHQVFHSLPRCECFPCSRGNQKRRRDLSFLNTLFPLFVSYMAQKDITRHVIIISVGCIGFIMICAATIFTTRRTMESLTNKTCLNQHLSK